MHQYLLRCGFSWFVLSIVPTAVCDMDTIYFFSIQDGKEESNSVTNQRALLRKYISGHEDFAGASVKEFLEM